jgi:Mrp family chromosome partitioning ATPase
VREDCEGKAFVANESVCRPTNGMGFGLAQIMLENPEVADAYDALFGDLRLAHPLASGNSILVTSTAPGEGKTTVSLCLAVTASLAGQTALLIDGDLRRSSLATTAGSADTVGLIEIMLVRRFSQIDGYRCLSLIRALAVVNCQSALA